MRLGTRITYLIMLFSLGLEVLAQEVTIYGYHHAPPYTFAAEHYPLTGINQEFVALLNGSDLGIKFTYKLIQRPDLNRLLENGEPALVIWANPTWFERDTLPRYLWSKAIFWDTDNIISLKRHNFQYSTPASLKGLLMGTNKGYFYKGIHKLVKEGLITRLDANGDLQNMQRLLSEEIDVAVMSRLSYFSQRKQVPGHELLTISRVPHSAFYRHILLTEDHQALLGNLNIWLTKLLSNKLWLQLVKKHSLRQTEN